MAPSLQAVLDFLPDAVLALDHVLRYCYLNPSAERLLKISRDCVVGRPWNEALPDLQGEPVATELSHAVESGRSVSFSAFLPEADCWVNVTVAPADFGVVLQLRDITSEREERARERVEVDERRRSERYLRAMTQQLQTVIRATNDGILVQDHRGGDLTVSARTLRMLGLPEDFPLDADSWEQRIHPDDRLGVKEALRRHIETATSSYTAEFRIRQQDGSYRWLQARGVAIRDGAAPPTTTVAALADVTERKSDEIFQRMGSYASALLMSFLDPNDALRSIIRVIVPHLADIACFDLVSEDGQTLRRATWAHAGPNDRTLMDQVLLLMPPEDSQSHPIKRVVATGEPVFLPDVAEVQQESSPELVLLAKAGIVSLICVPLVARGQAIGALTLGQSLSQRRQTQRDLSAATDLAQRVALAIDNARLYQAAQADIARRRRTNEELSEAYEKEHKIARVLQHALLTPPAETTFGSIEVDRIYRAARDEAEVGGDYFDVFPLSDRLIALVVGDISGKGLDAASRTAEIKYTLRTYLRERGDVASALSGVSAFLATAPAFDDSGPDYFIALSLVVVDIVSGEIVAGVAGAESPLIVRAGGHAETLPLQGLPLAVSADATYETITATLNPGDLLVLTTDGITEARSTSAGRALLGYDGLIALAVQACKEPTLHGIGQAILDGAIDYAGGRLHDDACILVARRKAE